MSLVSSMAACCESIDTSCGSGPEPPLRNVSSKDLKFMRMLRNMPLHVPCLNPQPPAELPTQWKTAISGVDFSKMNQCALLKSTLKMTGVNRPLPDGDNRATRRSIDRDGCRKSAGVRKPIVVG